MSINHENTTQSLNLSTLSAYEISALIRERKTSCEQLVHLYFSNIEKLPTLNAFICVNKAAALKQAKFWDQQISANLPCPSLIGVLIAVKDNKDICRHLNPLMLKNCQIIIEHKMTPFSLAF